MRNKNNLLIIKLKHSGSVWRKVIRQKYPGEDEGSHFPHPSSGSGAVSNGVRVKEKEKKKDKDKGRQSRKDSSVPGEGEILSSLFVRVGSLVILAVIFQDIPDIIGEVIHYRYYNSLYIMR